MDEPTKGEAIAYLTGLWAGLRLMLKDELSAEDAASLVAHLSNKVNVSIEEMDVEEARWEPILLAARVVQ